jgi:hypothetical protein
MNMGGTGVKVCSNLLYSTQCWGERDTENGGESGKKIDTRKVNNDENLNGRSFPVNAPLERKPFGET